MANDKNGPAWFLGGIAVGAIGAALWRGLQDDEPESLSRIEKEDLDWTDEVTKHVVGLFENLTIQGEVQNEREFHDILQGVLEEHCEYEVEREPVTPHGKPDILIGGALAIELKVNPNKSERNRLLGQVLDDSRQWRTWICLSKPQPAASRASTTSWRTRT